jgi:hypothetical protein
MHRPVSRACARCQANVDAASRFCVECGAFVPGGPPAGSRLASILSTVLGIPLGIMLVLAVELTMAALGILGVGIVIIVAWALHNAYPRTSDRISEVLTAIEACVIIGFIVYALIVGKPL